MFLFINSYPPKNSFTAFIKLLKFYKKVFTFFVSSGIVPKGGRSQFLANLSITELFQKLFWRFLLTFQYKTTLLLSLMNKSIHWASIAHKQRHYYHLLKTPNYIALFISPDDYDITVNRKKTPMLNAFNVSQNSPKQPPAPAR